MAELTPNTDVPNIETMVATMAAMAYEQYLRALVIEKVDDPNHIWDDRAVAAFDGIFGHKGA
jgi:hypothetical protein